MDATYSTDTGLTRTFTAVAQCHFRLHTSLACPHFFRHHLVPSPPDVLRSPPSLCVARGRYCIYNISGWGYRHRWHQIW